ncbi:MAG: glycosyltransferase family 2 protein [Gammaproteobacteria bacterium]|nr:glycosyltransferase family 2 protein [Gammaproteobacteria bacterium]
MLLLNNVPNLLSVIVTTYNRPDALSLVLQGLALQTKKNFEVLVADDGSTTETKSLIENNRWNFPIKHIWHEDQGFRAALIRNLAVKEAQGDYLLFIDGDCVPCSDFIKRHSELAEKGWFVAGSRLLLSPALTEDAVTGKKKILQWNFWHWLVARITGQCNRILPLLHLPFLPRKNKSQEWRGAKTCNLAMWHDDFNLIKGFNEHFIGWGYEDSDLVIRLLRANVRRKQGRSAVTVLHLWHKENDRQHEADNWRKLMQTKGGSSIVPENQ